MANPYDPGELVATVVDQAHSERRLREALVKAEAEINRLREELVKAQESSKSRQRGVR